MAIPFSQFLSFLLPTRPPPPLKYAPILPQSQSQSQSLSLPRSNKSKEGGAGFEGSCSSSSSELTAVMFPSLAHANTLYFQTAYNVQVVVEDNENEERLVNRFRREVMRAGVIQEVKRRRYFENKQEEKKRRTRDAAKRNSRRRRGPFVPRPGGPGQFGKEPGSATEAKAEDDGDNWEMPDEKTPF